MGIIFCEVPEMVIYLKQINTIRQPSSLPTSVAGCLSTGPEHLVIFGDPITFSRLNYVILKTLPLSKWSYSVLASKSNLFKTKEMKKPWVSSLGRNLKGHGIRWRLVETGTVPTGHAGQPCQSWCGTAGQGHSSTARSGSAVTNATAWTQTLPLFKGLIVPSL